MTELSLFEDKVKIVVQVSKIVFRIKVAMISQEYRE